MPEKRVDVVISGGGPNGLMLAAELCLGGVRPLVLDRLPGPSTEPRANGLVGQVVRLLDMRGLYERLSGRAEPPQPTEQFFFGGLTASFTAVDPNPLHLLPIPQPELVRQLAERAHDLGADLRWGHELVDLVQQEDEVVVTVSGPQGDYEISTRFLIGADGGKSLVRKKSGIEFPGTTGDSVTRMGHVRLPESLRAADGGLDVPGAGHLPFGFNRLERGVFVFAEIEPGRPLIAVGENGRAEPGELTFAELRAATGRVLGADLPIEPPTGPGPHALRRIDGQNTRLAQRYRAGNVFLVGDAAHVHSGVGGPGLNLGLQDAVNLAWKLAAHLRGPAPAGLLDTYQAERHPVGQRVMMSSLAQNALLAPGPEVTGLRELFGEFLRLPQVATHIAQLMAGSDLRYDLGDEHPCSGRLVGDWTIDTENGKRRVAELLHRARPVLLDLTGAPKVAEAAGPWTDRVEIVTATGVDVPADALLIRPDGYTAWAGSDPTRLVPALERWFGPAR